MDTATLGRVYASRDLLEAPYQDLLDTGRIKRSHVPLPTFNALAGHLRYVPKPFPSHRDFLDQHDFATWAKAVTAPGWAPSPQKAQKKTVKKSTPRRVPPKRNNP